ncbi:hypothetical protein GXW82_24410 [Streptacidiphilus sp. 4-A2]|nr:hypothetical protein [Streptacidiphilus sp. 4-A2]
MTGGAGVAAVPVPLVLGAVAGAGAGAGAGSGPESPRSQLVSLQDGRVLICRHRPDRQELVVRAPELPAGGGPGAGVGVSERSAGTLRMPGLRLLALPAAGPGAPVAVALGTDARPVTSVWLISADGAAPQQVAEFPGAAGGGCGWTGAGGCWRWTMSARAGAVRW